MSSAASFQASSPLWSTIEIRSDLDYDRAWNACFSVIARRFDIKVFSKEAGYIQSEWTPDWVTQEWTQEISLGGNWNHRATILFAPDKRSVQVRVESHRQTEDYSGYGFHLTLTETIRSDIMGLVGRATR
jgi:hypothetical protein